MAVNRFVLNGISYHGKGAIQVIPGENVQSGVAAYKDSGADYIPGGAF